MGIWEGLRAFFGNSGVANSALKIVDKIAGTDWTPEQKAEFLLKFKDATKNESPARRIIAIFICAAWLMLVTLWAVGSVIGRFGYDTAINSGTALAADVSAFISLNIESPFNLILSFYFATHLISKIKG